MNRRKIETIKTKYIILVVVAMALEACDPGFTYEPVGLESGRPSSQQTYEHQGISVTAWSFGGFSGHRGAIPEFRIGNETNETVEIYGCTIRSSAGEKYSSRSGGEAEELYRLTPGEKMQVAFFFKFTEMTETILGDHFLLEIYFRTESMTSSVKIEYLKLGAKTTLPPIPPADQ